MAVVQEWQASMAKLIVSTVVDKVIIILTTMLGVSHKQVWLTTDKGLLHVTFFWQRNLYRQNMTARKTMFHLAVRAYLLHFVGCTIFA